MTLHAKLHRLFLVDRQLNGLKGRVSGAKARHRKHNAHLKQLNTQNAVLSKQLKEVRASAHNLENEAKGINNKIQSLREHMNSVKTDKEYRAILVEVNTLKEGKGGLEDQALEALGKVEAHEVELKDLEGLIADAAKKVELALNEVNEGEAEIADQLTQLEAERIEAAKEVPPEALSHYEVQSEASDGEPMASIMEEDRRRLEYTCEGCYIQLPVEAVNKLLTRPNEMVICPSCGRILFISDTLRDSVGSSKKSSSST
jgi:predicted  nucleic acid-binding Zn-ribbon protein